MNKVLLFFILGIQFGFAQAPNPLSFKDRLYYGGNVGLGFGGGGGVSAFYAELSPMLGYMITDKLSVGPGLINQYKYQKFNLSPGKFQEFNSYNYGIRFFGRYQLFPAFFLHGEYETLSYNYLSLNQSSLEIEQNRRIVEALFVGGGYRSYMSARTAIDLSLLFNLNDNRYSPYPNPIFRVGLVFM